MTALHLAVLLRRYDICQLLAKNRVKMTPTTNSGVTPLTLVTEYRDPAMCRLLIQNGAKMDYQYKWGETPLEHAINIHNEPCGMTLVHLGCRLKRRQGKQSYFYMAIREKLLNLAELLAAIEPQFFNEPWIQSRNWPVSIFYNPGICNWLVSKASQPRSLMELCRCRIFRTLGRFNQKKCTLLPLPETLRSYVIFSKFMYDSFYELQPIINLQCPYDCAVKCRRRNCDDLDICMSDESDSELMYDES